MRRIISAAAGLWLGLVGTVLAQSAGDNPVVVELYTSQGCSSCPPADKILGELAARDDVIALGLHVDYWDYIGWKDIFANRQYSDRQRAYALHAGARTVYTPQMIVAGMDHLVGSRPAELDQLIRRHTARKGVVKLDIGRTGNRLKVRARTVTPLSRKAVVQVVRYLPERKVEIGRGENAGRTLTYSNIVTDWTRVAEWDGKSDLSLDLSASGSEPVVVIIQEDGPGPVLAAGRLR
ncbi:DUF1223 domain-containing protein [Defluviimonas aestuarii]|uniref:DUF1223 domain-containing protein n=1 Tax=Albidovulum aestuarii TaxID=1130726 RepID=UPI00249B5D2C|nr:DUF1223 domain-containing protein [Defluviimonas aestuarii]MDI3337380.1 DUF1223 domain-containing protein [Defluviimonas aestuarii]